MRVAARGHVELLREDGRVAGAHDVLREAGAERQAEAARARLVATLEATADFVGVAAHDGRIEYMNRGGRRLLGLAADADLTARSAREFHPPGTLALLEREGFPAAAADGRWQGEGELLDAAGARIPVAIALTAHPGLGPDAPPTFSAIMRDRRAALAAGAALRASEEAHRTLLASLPLIVYRVDPRPPYAPTYVSPGVSTLGWTHEEWTAAPDTWLRVLHPDDRERVLAETSAAMAAGRPLEYAYRVIARDGGVRWMLDRGEFVYDAGGAPVAWQGVMWDVTAQHLAEEALRASESRFRALFESTAVGVSVVDDAGTVVQANGAFEAFLGYGPGELVGRFAPDLSPPEDAAVTRAPVSALRDGRVPSVTVEKRFLRRDGAVRWASLSLSRIALGGGRAGVVGVTVDVTERRAAEGALERERAFLAATLESLSDGVVACDAEGRLTLFNRASREFHGLAPDEDLSAAGWAGRYSLRRADGATPLPTEEIPLVRAFVGEDVREAEFVIAPADRPARRLRSNGQAIRGPDGAMLGAVVAMRDVTEHDRAEAALRASEARFRMALDGGRHAYAVLRTLRGADGAVEDFEYVEVNETFEAMCGRAAEEVVGMRYTTLWPAALRDGMLDGYRRVVETGEPLEAERENRDPRVPARWIAVQVMPLADGVATLARDVTPQREAEEERRLLQEVTRALSHAPDAEHAIAAALQAMREASGWEYGDAWLTPRPGARGPARLAHGPASHPPDDAALARFAGADDGYTFAPGEGLPGRVWREAAPVVLPSLYAPEAGFSRLAEARAAGLSTGVGVPVMAEGAVVAVLTFHTRDARRITAAQVDRLGAVAAQVGAVVRRQLAEGALRESEAQFRGVLETVRAVAVTLDPDGRVTFANDALLQLTGWAREEAVGSDWFERFLADGATLRDAFGAMLRGETSVPHFEGALLTRGGERRLVAWDVALLRDADGAVAGTASIGRDVTEQRALEQRLAALSEHDELTGLLNRRGFRRMLEQSVKAAGRTGARDALLFLDLDRFKPINDTYGHAEGDQALRAVGEVLRGTVRDADFSARFGGDEFAVYAVGLRESGEGHVLAARLQARLAEHNRAAAAAGRPYEIGFSVGVAEVEPGDTPETLLARADAALYARKLARR
ncbi:PAS domain S-box protein [Roseisolibacter sp. H3M3-2]|nr:PAS domain S-box protein [Roseisolibacter sp. H3M3-2]